MQDNIKEIDKFYNWISSFENLNKEKDEIGESFYMLKVNYPPFIGLFLDLTTVNNKPCIIFKTDNMLKYYAAEKVEMSSKNYDTDGKYMRSFKVDNKFWFYEERIPNAPIGSGITCSFGMDMKMPFLLQQNWKDITNII